MNEPSSATSLQTGRSFRGLFRGGLVRLVEDPPWPDGVEVEVRILPEAPQRPVHRIGPVIIAGFGLAGRWVGQILDSRGIPYTVVEKNPDTVHRQQLLGRSVILGDIAQQQTLLAAGITSADILALTIPEERDVLEAIRLTRALNPRVYIVARTNYTSAGMEAAQLGADAVVKAEQAVAHRFYELLLHRIQNFTPREEATLQ